jgi:hypothetical protein
VSIQRSNVTRRRGLLTIAALTAALLAAPAAAQQADQADVEFQSYRIPGWSFTPALAAGAMHDTNVALTTATAEAGETQSDTIFSIVPSGQLEYLGRRSDFSASYRGFLRRYAEVRGLDGYDQRAVVRFKRAMSRRVSLFLRNNYADAPTTDEVDLNGVPFQRRGNQMNTFTVGSDVRVSKFTTLSTRYDHTWVDFQRDPDVPLPIGAVSGGTIHALRGEVGYRFSERLTMGGEYGYRTSSLDEDTRQFWFQDAGGVVRFRFGAHTNGSAAAGFAVLHDRTRNDTRNGPYVRLGIDHDLERATVGASFERQYVPSFGFGGASSSQELRGHIMMPFVRQRFYVQGSAAWRRSLPFEVDALELDTIWIRSTIGYAATRWGRVEALYTYTRQDSSITGGEVDRHRLGVQFVVSQPMRIR